MTKRQIISVTIILEGLLVIAFAAWAHYTQYPFDILPSISQVFYGIAYCIPLLVLNFVLFGPPARNLRSLDSLRKFCNEIIKPLADKFDTVTALAVSIAAGLGEELFFRGLLQQEFTEFFSSSALALLLSAVLFSLVHFGAYVKNYLAIALIYALIGVYFGVIVLIEESLWPAIIAHASYDFLAIVYLKNVYKVPPKHPCEM